MKAFYSFFFLMGVVLLSPCGGFHFITRKWRFDGSRENIDALAVDNGNIFLSRNNKMLWFRPEVDKPIYHLSRDLPRTINNLSVKKKALLVNMVPEDIGSVSETLVFANNKCGSTLWKDNTMYETVIEENGYLLRGNFFGNITYGNHENMFAYNTRTLTNFTYSTMFVYGKHLWCATEYKSENGDLTTRVDAFDLFVKRDGIDYISSVPDMTFLVDNKGCMGPCKLCVSIEKSAPKNIVYIIIGYMMGGVNVAQGFIPTEKACTHAMCSNLPNEYTVRSIS